MKTRNEWPYHFISSWYFVPMVNISRGWNLISASMEYWSCCFLLWLTKSAHFIWKICGSCTFGNYIERLIYSIWLNEVLFLKASFMNFAGSAHLISELYVCAQCFFFMFYVVSLDGRFINLFSQQYIHSSISFVLCFLISIHLHMELVILVSIYQYIAL